MVNKSKRAAWKITFPMANTFFSRPKRWMSFVNIEERKTGEKILFFHIGPRVIP